MTSSSSHINGSADTRELGAFFSPHHLLFSLPCFAPTRQTHTWRQTSETNTQCDCSLTACGPGIHTIRRYRWLWQGHTVITQRYMKARGIGLGENEGSKGWRAPYAVHRTPCTLLRCDPSNKSAGTRLAINSISSVRGENTVAPAQIKIVEYQQ